MRSQLKIFLAAAVAFVAFTSETAGAVESNRVWVEMNGAQDVSAGKSFEVFVG